MGTLFISFLVAIGGAVGLVVISKTLDLETYSTRVFPLIPILYALVYEMMEKRRTGRVKPIPPSQMKQEMKAGAALIFQNITFGRIAGDVGAAFLIKFSLEIMVTVAHSAISQQTFSSIYGNFGVETVGRILRGDHPWLGDSQAMVLLSLIAFTTSLGTGLWIGNTTKANPILEGVLAGTAITVITSMTNMLILYRQIEEMADQTVQSLGYVWHIGFAVVVTLQVLLYGLWSGIAQRAKKERAARAAAKKAAKRSRT